MFALAVVVTIVVALQFLLSGAGKLAGIKQSIGYRDHLNVSPALWKAIGVLEVAGAAGVLIGLGVAALGIAAGTGLVLLMIGALGYHRRAHDPLPAVTPAIVALVLAAVALILRIVTL